MKHYRREIVPQKSLRKFDEICLHNEVLRQNVDLQQQILSWAEKMIEECREEWNEMRGDTIETVIKCHYKSNVQKGGIERDKKYAQFREIFARIQKEKYECALQKGNRFTANGFVEWFLANKAGEIQIPYLEQNQKNKLRQLAQQNNREFKKLLPS